MNRSPKNPRPPLEFRKPVTGWCEDGRAPTESVDHREMIYNDLLQAALDFCGDDPLKAAAGESVLAQAATLIAELDADHVFMVQRNRQPRGKKATRTEVVAMMREFRKQRPDDGLPEFVACLESLRELERKDDLYIFNLLTGEYQIRDLNRLWADAGKAPEK